MPTLGQGIAGLRSQTPGDLILDVGALYVNINETLLQAGNVSGALAVGYKMGATRGGASFSTGKKVRDVAVDGMRYPLKDMQRIDEYKPILTVTLLEMGLTTFQNILSQQTTIHQTGYREIQLDVDVESSDYLTNVALVTTHTGSDSPIILLLRNAMNVEAAEFKYEDRNEAIVQCKFQAHASVSAPHDSPVSEYFPWEGVS